MKRDRTRLLVPGSIVQLGVSLAYFPAVERHFLLLSKSQSHCETIASVLSEINPEGYFLDHCSDVKAAISEIEEQSYDVILTDQSIPENDLTELASTLRKMGFDFLPVVMLARAQDQINESRIAESGITDFIRHDQLTAHNLDLVVRYAIKQKWAEARAEHLAYHDPLTSLPNRALLMDRLEQTMFRSRRRSKFSALLFFDLDRFKTINDTFGHDTGDKLICEIADTLSSHIRAEDTLARLGGDEFVLLLAELADDPLETANRAHLVARKMRAATADPIIIGDAALDVSFSIGVATFPADDESCDDVLKRADSAMYQAKSDGRNRIVVDKSNIVPTNLKLQCVPDNPLAKLIAGDELQVHYQPIFNPGHSSIRALEAFIRWQHPTRGLLPADQFLTELEQQGLIVAANNRVLEIVARDLDEWPEIETISINVSTSHFTSSDFVRSIKAQVERVGLAPSQLCFELRENISDAGRDIAAAKISALRSEGFSFTLDNFGRNIASLADMKNLSVNAIKIAREYVGHISEQGSNVEMIQALINVSRIFGYQVAAEGVESLHQKQILDDFEVDSYQGFYFAYPIPAEDVSTLLAGGTAASAGQIPLQRATIG